MSIWHVVSKVLKGLGWFVFAMIILFLFVGYFKFDGGARDYFQYLNDKDWSDAVQQVKILKFSTYGALFWEENEMQVISGATMEDGDMVTEDVQLTTGNDIYDPAFEEDFESFFDPENTLSDETEVFVADDFGFFVEGSGDMIEEEPKEILDDGNGYLGEESDLSENKQNVLKMFAE